MLSKRHPILYKAAIAAHRTKRRVAWHLDRKNYAQKGKPEELPFRLFRHQSVLLRKLGNADMRLQHNKVANLSIAAQCINHVTIRPGETFSLWKLVGKPSAKRGFLEGMLLSQGAVKAGVGGGLCQMANLLYWMFLHSPLTVTERFHHSIDVFPDSGRVLPFGSGATIFYNYIDLQCVNNTDQTFQLCLWLTDTHLCGELRSDTATAVRYHVFERDHAFLFNEKDGKNYRTNTIWREVRDANTGQPMKEEFLMKNVAPMLYTPPEGVTLEPYEKYVAK